MLEIKMEFIDELNNLAVDFSVLTYLQSLVHCDADRDIIRDDALAFACACAGDYLWERQLETVARFQKLLDRKDFIRHVHISDCNLAQNEYNKRKTQCEGCT